MDKYELRFPAAGRDGDRRVSFHAHSTASALELAKDAASGSKAELFLNGRSICRMRLVEDTGVWLVTPTAGKGEDIPDTI